MLTQEIRQEILGGNSTYTMDLIKQVSPLIVSMIKKYNCEEFEDTFQSSIEVLLKCVKKYKYTMNVPFIAYYQMNLRYFHLNNQYNKYKEILCLDSPINEEEITLKDNITSNEKTHLEKLISLEENKGLIQSIEKLTPKQKWIIKEHFFQGKTLVEISKETKKNYQGLVKLKARVISRLKEMMELEDC